MSKTLTIKAHGEGRDRKGRIRIENKAGEVTQNTPYAKWEDIDKVVRPILSEHGFALSFKPGVAADGRVKRIDVA